MVLFCVSVFYDKGSCNNIFSFMFGYVQLICVLLCV